MKSSVSSWEKESIEKQKVRGSCAHDGPVNRKAPSYSNSTYTFTSVYIEKTCNSAEALGKSRYWCFNQIRNTRKLRWKPNLRKPLHAQIIPSSPAWFLLFEPVAQLFHMVVWRGQVFSFYHAAHFHRALGKWVGSGAVQSDSWKTERKEIMWDKSLVLWKFRYLSIVILMRMFESDRRPIQRSVQYSSYRAHFHQFK